MYGKSAVVGQGRACSSTYRLVSKLQDQAAVGTCLQKSVRPGLAIGSDRSVERRRAMQIGAVIGGLHHPGSKLTLAVTLRRAMQRIRDKPPSAPLHTFCHSQKVLVVLRRVLPPRHVCHPSLCSLRVS